MYFAVTTNANILSYTVGNFLHLPRERERLPRPSKLTQSHLRAGIQLSICRKALYACASSALRENLLTRDFTNSGHHHHLIIIFFFFSKPAISMLQRVDWPILSRSVSRVDGGVDGHKAIVSFFFFVCTVDRRAPHGIQ